MRATAAKRRHSEQVPQLLSGPRERKPRISRLTAALWLVAVVAFVALILIGVIKKI